MMTNEAEVLAKFRELVMRKETDVEDDVMDLVRHFGWMAEPATQLGALGTLARLETLESRMGAAEDRASRLDNEVAGYRGEIDDLRARVERLERASAIGALTAVNEPHRRGAFIGTLPNCSRCGEIALAVVNGPDGKPIPLCEKHAEEDGYGAIVVPNYEGTVPRD